jgi:hypothetical protein
MRIDGLAFLKVERRMTADYSGGFIRCPEVVWGGIIDDVHT